MSCASPPQQHSESVEPLPSKGGTLNLPLDIFAYMKQASAPTAKEYG